jgi:hypothetical protein
LRRRAGSVVKEIRRLRIALKVAHHSLAHLSRHVAAVAGNPSGNGRSRSRLSPEARASLVLQGRYMGYVRQLKPRQKAQVRKIREMKGVRAAIARARALAEE